MTERDGIVPEGDALQEQARTSLAELVEAYERYRGTYTQGRSTYNEAQVRIDFINPLLDLLGWDVVNRRRAPHHLRDVIQEDAVIVEEEESRRQKNPDYGLQVSGRTKLFVESKRPSFPIDSRKSSAYQIRSYGWSASLKASILTNFEHLAIYDTRHIPRENDEPEVARWRLFHYSEYLDHFEEIYGLLSRSAVYAGSIDSTFESLNQPGAEPFNQYFLTQIENWRTSLADAILKSNPELSAPQINEQIQQLVNRIVFLRVCEGRRIEAEERLRTISTYDELKALFLEADKRYNSGLFEFMEDDLSLSMRLDPQVLVSIFRDLYMPQSPFAFSVVSPAILGEIYEAYLGHEVKISDEGISIVEKPEVAQTSGVVVTPSPIAERIVQATLEPLIAGKSPDELTHISVADLSCGSGTFLLAAYTHLLNYHIQWYIDHNRNSLALVEGERGNFRLTLHEKRRILESMIYGVDIDQQAVEVTRFSLLLKMIEDETEASISDYVEAAGHGALPNLNENIKRGNSLVDGRYFEHNPKAELDFALIDRVVPSDFSDLFPKIMKRGGFDAIVGNPPYVRIQRLAEYSPEELSYFQGPYSPYTVATRGNIDKYFLFIERALGLANEEGRIGYIVQNRFFVSEAGEALRGLLTSGKHLNEVIDFNLTRVFEGRTTYPAILLLSRKETNSFTFERVSDLKQWLAGQPGFQRTYESIDFDASPWRFASASISEVFSRLEGLPTKPLQEVAEILVGLQTSSDDVYIHRPENLDQIFDRQTFKFKTQYAIFEKDGKTWPIETDILVPCVKNAQIVPFQSVQPNALMIFPYHPGTRNTYSPAEMQAKFPKAWEYLNAYKDQLDERSMSGKNRADWYRFGRPQNLDKFQGGDTLIWRVLAQGAPYAFDNRGVRATGGGYGGPHYGLQLREGSAISIYYLLAVLSHPLLEALVRTSSHQFQSAYYPHSKQFIEDLPIYMPDKSDSAAWALHDEIVLSARALIDVTDKLVLERHTKEQKHSLEIQQTRLRASMLGKVSRLYGISEDDFNVLTEFISRPRE